MTSLRLRIDDACGFCAVVVHLRRHFLIRSPGFSGSVARSARLMENELGSCRNRLPVELALRNRARVFLG